MTSSELRTDREKERRRKSETLLTPLTGNCPIPVLDLGSWILDRADCSRQRTPTSLITLMGTAVCGFVPWPSWIRVRPRTARLIKRSCVTRSW